MDNYTNYLESGHLIHTNWERQVGDSCAIPGKKPTEYSKVLYTFTKAEFTEVQSLIDKMVSEYFTRKTRLAKLQIPFNEESKVHLLIGVLNTFIQEKYSQEAFLIATPKFN